jgi:hypothetical protein
VIGHNLPRQSECITVLAFILPVGYLRHMPKKKNEAALLLAKKSVQARREKWGEKAFVQKMRKWGKLGGRPPKKGKHDGD